MTPRKLDCALQYLELAVMWFYHASCLRFMSLKLKWICSSILNVFSWEFIHNFVMCYSCFKLDTNICRLKRCNLEFGEGQLLLMNYNCSSVISRYTFSEILKKWESVIRVIHGTCGKEICSPVWLFPYTRVDVLWGLIINEVIDRRFMDQILDEVLLN